MNELDFLNIKKFLKGKKDIVGAYLYGMTSYFGHKNYHLFLVSNDINSWKKEIKYERDSNDIDDIEVQDIIENYDFITHVNDRFNGCIFDYIVVSLDEFENSLNKLSNMYFTNIFENPFIKIQDNNDLTSIIENNRRVFLLSCLQRLNKSNCSLSEIFEEMFNYLSYIPNNEQYFYPKYKDKELKLYIKNNYSKLKEIYKNNPYYTLDNNDIAHVNQDLVENDLKDILLDVFFDKIDESRLLGTTLERANMYQEDSNLVSCAIECIDGFYQGITHSFREEKIRRKSIKK